MYRELYRQLNISFIHALSSSNRAKYSYNIEQKFSSAAIHVAVTAVSATCRSSCRAHGDAVFSHLFFLYNSSSTLASASPSIWIHTILPGIKCCVDPPAGQWACGPLPEDGQDRRVGPSVGVSPMTSATSTYLFIHHNNKDLEPRRRVSLVVLCAFNKCVRGSKCCSAN